MSQGDASKLGDWINAPVVQDAVIRFMSDVTEPVLLAEVAEHCGIRIANAQRVLGRLHAKGFVTRYKIPIQRDGWNRRTKQPIPGGCTRLLYIYSLAEPDE